MKKIFSLLLILILGTFAFADATKAEEYFTKAQKYENQDNVFYALLNYYNAMMEDSENFEYVEKYFSYSDLIASGSPGTKLYDDFEKLDRWMDIYYDYVKFYTDNCPFYLSFHNLHKGELNYEDRTTEYLFEYMPGIETKEFEQISLTIGKGLSTMNTSGHCFAFYKEDYHSKKPHIEFTYSPYLYKNREDIPFTDTKNHPYESYFRTVINPESEGKPSYPAFLSFSNWNIKFSFADGKEKIIIPAEKFSVTPGKWSTSFNNPSYLFFYVNCDTALLYNSAKISLTQDEIKKIDPLSLHPVITKIELLYDAPDENDNNSNNTKQEIYTPSNQTIKSSELIETEAEIFKNCQYYHKLSQLLKDRPISKLVVSKLDSQTYIETDTENIYKITLTSQEINFIEKQCTLNEFADLVNLTENFKPVYTNSNTLNEYQGYKYYSETVNYSQNKYIAYISKLSPEESRKRIEKRIKKEEEARIAAEQAALKKEQERLNTISNYETIVKGKLKKLGITLELTDEITYKSKPDNIVRIYKIIPEPKTVARQGKFPKNAYLLIAENKTISNDVMSMKDKAEYFINFANTGKKYIFLWYYDGDRFVEADPIKLPKDW